MYLDLFSTFKDAADHNGILLYYNGVLSENVIATMADSLKQKLKNQEEGGAKSRKLFSSFIELTQNAFHYSPELKENTGEKICAIAVGIKDTKHFIICGNLVQKNNIDSIKNKIEPLLSMSNDEIKKAYREQLRNESHHDVNPESKGAGLGLLTIARDASEPIEYMLHDVNDELNSEFALFYLKATI